MNPTEKEKDRCEYELELARLALAKGAKGDSDARKFKALQWREEARTAVKRRIIEDGRRDKILKRKRLAVEAVEKDAYGSKAEVDKADEELQEMTPAEIVQIPDPKGVLNEETGVHIISQFRFSFILFLSISFIIRKYKNIFSARRMDYIEMSDADEVDQNTRECLYPEQIMPFKKNKLGDNEDD